MQSASSIIHYSSFIPSCHARSPSPLTLSLTDFPIKRDSWIRRIVYKTLRLSQRVPPQLITLKRQDRNINRLDIDYAFRPRLSSRLTPSWRTLLGKPWTFGRPNSHRTLATHTGILTTAVSNQPYSWSSKTAERSPTDRTILQARKCGPAASVNYLASIHFRRHITRPVRCYAIFQGWLLLSRPPGCLGDMTSFPT